MVISITGFTSLTKFTSIKAIFIHWGNCFSLNYILSHEIPIIDYRILQKDEKLLLDSGKYLLRAYHNGGLQIHFAAVNPADERLLACAGAEGGSSLRQLSRPVPPPARRAASTSRSGCFTMWRKSGSRPPETTWATSESWSQSSSTCPTSCSTPTTSSSVRHTIPPLCISPTVAGALNFLQPWLACAGPYSYCVDSEKVNWCIGKATFVVFFKFYLLILDIFKHLNTVQLLLN